MLHTTHCPTCGIKISAYTSDLLDRGLAGHIKRVHPAQIAPEPESSAILGIGGIGIFTENEMPQMPRQPKAQPKLVHCDCGHDVPQSWVMNASTGTSCPDCYDRMSD